MLRFLLVSLLALLIPVFGTTHQADRALKVEELEIEVGTEKYYQGTLRISIPEGAPRPVSGQVRLPFEIVNNEISAEPNAGVVTSLKPIYLGDSSQNWLSISVNEPDLKRGWLSISQSRRSNPPRIPRLTVTRLFRSRMAARRHTCWRESTRARAEGCSISFISGCPTNSPQPSTSSSRLRPRSGWRKG